MCKDKSYQRPKRSSFVLTDIQQTLSNFASQCQLAVIRVLVDLISASTLFYGLPTDILLTISNLASTIQLFQITLTLTQHKSL